MPDVSETPGLDKGAGFLGRDLGHNRAVRPKADGRT